MNANLLRGCDSREKTYCCQGLRLFKDNYQTHLFVRIEQVED